MVPEDGERDGGRTDIFAPDSDWDADLANAATVVIMSGLTVTAAPNDWADIDDDYIAIDPLWGSSFQVYSIDTVNNQIAIRWYNKDTDLYEIVNVDANLIYNIYRRLNS